MPPRNVTFAARDAPETTQAGLAEGKEEAPRCSVLLPLPLEGAYDYLAPGPTGLEPGTYVTVPLGRRIVPGVVWDVAPDGDAVASERLRPVEGILDVPPMREELRRFVNWVAAYTMTAP